MSGAAADPGRASDPGEVFHMELRQFPHNVCRFNLSEQELRTTVVEPWAREQWIELGERKWSPHQANLTVIAGPRIPVGQLSMGRGWRTAQRQGRDVTASLLEAAKEGASSQTPPDLTSAASAAQVGAVSPSQTESLMADSLGLELLTVLGSGQVPLHRCWELARERHPERTAGESLTLAERAVASLLRSGLIVLTLGDSAGDAGREVGEEEVQAVLRDIDSWSAETTAADPANDPAEVLAWVGRA